ncbi:MAG: sporulation protein YqfD [Clostridiales bacterium]|nr:sporulation protein YqfD [Clostridiales bacterium]
MFIVKILRWLRGYVVFCVSDGFSERFLNLCSNAGVMLWNTRMRGEMLFSNVRAGEYRHLREYAKKSGVKMRVKERHGMPFLIKRYRARSGLAFGFVFLLAFVYVMSSMVWIVEIEGNSKVPDSQIYSVLSQLGVRQGALKGGLDIQEIQRRALSGIPELSWLSVNIDGCLACIEVREQTAAPEVTDLTTPSNVVASRDGQIIKLEVLEGKAAQKNGSAVVKGDLLINGITEDKDGTPRLHRARGNVVALTSHEAVCEIPFITESEILSSEKTRYSLIGFSLKLPLGISGDDMHWYSHTSYACTGETVLPLGIERERFAVYSPGEITLSENQAQLLAVEEFFHIQRRELAGTEVTASQLSLEFGSDSCKISGKYMCEEKIGEERRIIIE